MALGAYGAHQGAQDMQQQNAMMMLENRREEMNRYLAAKSMAQADLYKSFDTADVMSAIQGVGATQLDPYARNRYKSRLQLARLFGDRVSDYTIERGPRGFESSGGASIPLGGVSQYLPAISEEALGRSDVRSIGGSRRKRSVDCLEEVILERDRWAHCSGSKRCETLRQERVDRSRSRSKKGVASGVTLHGLLPRLLRLRYRVPDLSLEEHSVRMATPSPESLGGVTLPEVPLVGISVGRSQGLLLEGGLRHSGQVSVRLEMLMRGVVPLPRVFLVGLDRMGTQQQRLLQIRCLEFSGEITHGRCTETLEVGQWYPSNHQFLNLRT